MKIKILCLLLGLGAVALVADRLGLGPYRPRFPVTSGGHREPPSVLTREQSNLMADIYAIGVHRDRSQIAKVRAALQEDHPAIVKVALKALGRLGATEAVEDIHALQRRLTANSEIQPVAALALARIEAERTVSLASDRERLQKKVGRFLGVAAVSVNQIHKGASWYASERQAGRYDGPPPFEVRVLRGAAEIAEEAYQKGVQDAFTVAGLDFSRDYPAQLKVKLSQMSRQQRIEWLVESLSQKRVLRAENYYDLQALADEGESASKAIIAKLREMKAHRDQYPHHIGFSALFDTLIAIGDPNTVPVVRSFSKDGDAWVGYYADQALGYLEKNWRKVWADL